MRRFWMVTLAALAACGGQVQGSGATNDVDAAAPAIAPSGNVAGEVRGRTIDVKDAVAVFSRKNEDGDFQTQLMISLTDASALCDDLRADLQQRNTHYVNILLIRHSSRDGAQIGPGTYGVSADEQALGDDRLFASGGFGALDETCRNLARGDVATSGSITLTEVTASGVRGRFQLTFPTGDRLEGSFATPSCDVDVSKNIAPGCH